MNTNPTKASVIARVSSTALLMAVLVCPTPALAQSSDRWQFTLAPLYLWATAIDGKVGARGETVPVSLDFADAADNLAAAFAFHFEAHKNRLGFYSDLNFVRLSTGTELTAGPAGGVTVDGNVDFDSTTFEAGASFLVREGTPFGLFGGIRTYTVSPKIEFITQSVQVTPIDASRTSVNGLVGFFYRPRLGEKWTLLTRADIGGGGGMTWSGLLGVEFRPKPWAGLVLAYKGFGIDAGSDSDDQVIREYDLVYYGPVFALNFHFGGK